MSTALAPLWHIEEHLLALLDTIDATPEELKPEIQAEIDRYFGQEVAKVDHIAHVLAALEYEQKAAGDEITRLQERKKEAKARQEKLEAYICRVIAMRGVKKLEGATNTLSVKPSDAVKITDPSAIPDGYKTAAVKLPLWLWHSVTGVVSAFAPQDVRRDVERVVAEETISKDSVKKALKSGVEVPGADLELRDNLQRK